MASSEFKSDFTVALKNLHHYRSPDRDVSLLCGVVELNVSFDNGAAHWNQTGADDVLLLWSDLLGVTVQLESDTDVDRSGGRFLFQQVRQLLNHTGVPESHS
ncbi:hypothetical protein WICPIJ_005878 [Wickerhamomyces pijperi]|uniref:Uncharacterized protein n=1 Tax=Wickerhamomyces pijperi TaxID=599730 RepID=A0A9P8TLI9_WICPI|nr:hypothetical protein WICPIJ_005878 [Wickerhamomyces pijperi]